MSRKTAVFAVLGMLVTLVVPASAGASERSEEPTDTKEREEVVSFDLDELLAEAEVDGVVAQAGRLVERVRGSSTAVVAADGAVLDVQTTEGDKVPATEVRFRDSRGDDIPVQITAFAKDDIEIAIFDPLDGMGLHIYSTGIHEDGTLMRARSTGPVVYPETEDALKSAVRSEPHPTQRSYAQSVAFCWMSSFKPELRNNRARGYVSIHSCNQTASLFVSTQLFVWSGAWGQFIPTTYGDRHRLGTYVGKAVYTTCVGNQYVTWLNATYGSAVWAAGSDSATADPGAILNCI